MKLNSILIGATIVAALGRVAMVFGTGVHKEFLLRVLQFIVVWKFFPETKVSRWRIWRKP